jgi:hypothetical protein
MMMTITIIRMDMNVYWGLSASISRRREGEMKG